MRSALWHGHSKTRRVCGNPREDIADGRLSPVVKPARLRIRFFVFGADGGVGQDECLVLRNVGVVPAAKAPLFVRLIVVTTDELLHLGTVKQAVDIVIVPHDVCGRLPAFLLQAEFRRNRLKLFNKRIARQIARHRECSVIDDFNTGGRVVVSPGADVLGDIWRDRIETSFQQNTVLEIGHGVGKGIVKKLYSSAAVAAGRVIESCIAFDLFDPVLCGWFLRANRKSPDGF